MKKPRTMKENVMIAPSLQCMREEDDAEERSDFVTMVICRSSSENENENEKRSDLVRRKVSDL